MKHYLLAFFIFGFLLNLNAQQQYLAQDYLSKDFHKERREALRKFMPKNSVAVIFANPIRNRANDVDFHYHQNPNFYYLTGYNEPHSLILIFKENQNVGNKLVNEVLFVQEKNELVEMWNGKRLGIKGAQDNLGFRVVFNGKDFKSFDLDFSKFDKILFTPFLNDVKDTKNEADLFDLIKIFKSKIPSHLLNVETLKDNDFYSSKKSGSNLLPYYMASLREVKTEEELKLLKKAIDISAIGQIEIMKAMHPKMSELEVQGIHEFVYKKYGAEYEGYPSIVGAGGNGCILHYIENNKVEVGEGKLVLMDLGAEYHGYTADVTRTIPANGKFTEEQKAIYNLVYKAQTEAIKAVKVGSYFGKPTAVARKIINKGLAELGVISSENDYHNYFPHGASHHIGLDVHDTSNYGKLKENMVITIEPGIYIPKNSDCDEKWWDIAVRIEDDILVLKEGPINLSERAPRTAEAIEKMMQMPSALDDFILPTLE
ncbi:aminopeptidase P N-terminal domain-containing protein [Lutibacter sp. TH_r2]|uniref:aminopeptidase P N-terminal domain-containing protein n=1 Tax=Lutibacter sp. TH_r2 TaxID=3082083 RepID=UPI0029550BA8|nr:aminopeptidase P N-terminal domain-containing protein [Lutibacter sp. TH_r2]MDV7188272.1 aminopeptidase P N-terminal domain-containing protein [Lutibacter sp. TH_r2]